MKKINNIIVKFKDFYKNPYGMLITVSWLLLIVCLIIKLFGGNWFELGSENGKFIEFCNYVETRQYLKMIIGCVIYLLSAYFIMSVFLKEKIKPKHIIIFAPIMILKCILSWYFSVLAFILDLIILIVIPIIFTKKWKRILICFVVLNALQIITLLLRNVSFGFGIDYFNYNLFIIQLLYQIDYYIMIILWYLYVFKKKGI